MVGVLRTGCTSCPVAGAEQERAALGLQQQQGMEGSPLRVLFMAGFSYKTRLASDLATVQAPAFGGDWRGPREMFEALAVKLFAQQAFNRVSFLGRLSEADKLAQLDEADLLVRRTKQ